MAEGRQLFSYKGVEYDLPASYTPQQALARIKGHLGESSAPAKPAAQPKPKTSVGVLEGIKRGITEDVPYGLGTALDFTAGGLADLFGDTKSADTAFKRMEERTAGRKKLQEVRAQNEIQGFGSKAGQAVVGAIPQMLSAHATQAAEDVQAGATTGGALKSLGVNTGAQALGMLLPAGKGIIKGAAVGAATSAPLSYATDELNKRIQKGTGAEQNYQKTAEDYLLEAAVGAGVGGVLGPLGSKKKLNKKVEDTSVDSRLDARINQQLQTQVEKANANKNLTPADIETPAPAGTNFEMQLPGGKGTKAGRKAYERQQKVRGDAGTEEQVVGLTPEEQAAQLDMFVEDNRKVVEDNLFRIALENSQRAAAEESAALIAQARRLEEQAQANEALTAQQRRDYTRRAAELFDEAAAKEEHAKRVFESNLRASQDAEAQRSASLFEAERQQEQLALDQEANDRRVLRGNLEESQRLGAAESRSMLDEAYARELARQQAEQAAEAQRQADFWAPTKRTPDPIEPQQLRVGDSYINEADLPLIGESPYGRPVQSMAARDAERKIAGDFAVRDLVDENGNSLFGDLPKGQQQAIGNTYNSIARRKGQGGFIDPRVFVEGFKAGFDLIARGVKSFATFAKELITKFGNAIKPYLPQIWSGSNKHIKQTKQAAMTFTQKHGVPLREAFNRIKDARSLELLSEATVALANVKDMFKRTVYDQQYSGDPLSSGIKWGKSAPLVRFFKNPARDSMLTKYAKYMNSGEVIDPRKLGWSKQEIEAYLDLRDALDTIGKMEGIDITNNPNYFPRMRIGKYVAIARDAQGKPHIEAADGMSSSALARKLEKEGYTVEAHGTKADIYSNPQYRSMLADDFLAEGFVPDPFSAHRKDAGNVSGWTGQRGDPKDLLRAIEIYLKRAENGLQREAVLPIVEKIRQELPTDKADAMVKYLEKAVGLEFLHTPQFLRDIENGLNKLPGFNQHDKVINGVSKAFYWLKVIPGMANGIQALMSAPMFAPQQLMRMTDQGVSAPKALYHITKSTIGSLLGIDNPRNIEIASRAERAGYIQNPTDLIGISQKLGRGKLINQAAEMLYDPFRASRLEMKARKDFMVGMYNYYVHEMKLDSETAFHRAGQNTLDAFVNLHPEDRAPWQSSLGTVGRPLSALTTYPIGMASKIYQNIGSNTTPGQKKALVAIGLGAVLAGGLRGAPISDIMEPLVMIYNMVANDEDQLSSADDALIQLGEKYPEFGWVLNGIPSQILGVDMSRSLGWPGLSMVIPYWAQLQDVAKSASNTAFGTELRSDGLIPPALSGMGNFAKGAYELGKDAIQGGMTPAEKESAWQAVLPRAVQKAQDTPDVYNKREDRLGVVSPAAQEAAKLTGTRSLEEANIRAKEATFRAREKGLQNTKTEMINQIVKSIVYNQDNPNLSDQFSKVNDQLATYNMAITSDEIKSAIKEEIKRQILLKSENELSNKDVTRLMLEGE